MEIVGLELKARKCPTSPFYCSGSRFLSFPPRKHWATLLSSAPFFLSLQRKAMTY